VFSASEKDSSSERVEFFGNAINSSLKSESESD
jgi:hypothetical protein